jgi:hypothetical protein
VTSGRAPNNGLGITELAQHNHCEPWRDEPV